MRSEAGLIGTLTNSCLDTCRRKQSLAPFHTNLQRCTLPGRISQKRLLKEQQTRCGST
jgi:hypothetical protein